MHARPEWLGAFTWPILTSLAGLSAAWVYGGTAALGAVAVLIALESSVSFDNAVINAGVLRELDRAWRRAFLTIGVVIAVFGMRIVLPIVIVAVATGRSFTRIVDQALHDQEAYARNVEAAPISSDLILIAIGLGAGAIYVRSLTVYMVRRHALQELPYLTHGAHWAIGALGIFLLVGIERHPPEWLTGGVGMGLLGAAWVSSLVARRRPKGPR